MANKRFFKKYIDTVCSNIAGEMTEAAVAVEGADVQAIDDAIIELLTAGADALSKSNVKYDRSASSFPSEREYHAARRHFYHELFEKIHKEFTACVNDVLKKFNAAMPERLEVI